MGLLLMHVIYVQLNDSKYKKKFVCYGIGFYLFFLVFMLVSAFN